MNGKVVEKVQRVLLGISLKSVGKSIPINTYEREIPKEVISLCKQKNTNQEER